MINYNEEHMLSGGCTRASECDGGMEFQWLLYLCNKAGYGDELTCDDVPTHKLNEISSLPLNNSLYYGAKARVYEKNRWYKISFRGYRTPFVYGESTMSFFVNTPPEEGEYCVSVINFFRVYHIALTNTKRVSNLFGTIKIFMRLSNKLNKVSRRQ